MELVAASSSSLPGPLRPTQEDEQAKREKGRKRKKNEDTWEGKKEKAEFKKQWTLTYHSVKGKDIFKKYFTNSPCPCKKNCNQNHFGSYEISANKMCVFEVQLWVTEWNVNEYEMEVVVKGIFCIPTFEGMVTIIKGCAKSFFFKPFSLAMAGFIGAYQSLKFMPSLIHVVKKLN